jgi:predicted amino acid-binding ACT domain protein
MAEALEQGAQVLTFTRTRQSAELVRRYSQVTNEGSSPVGIDFLSSAMLHGLADPQKYDRDLRIHVGFNSWMAEGQWHTLRPSEMGFVENERTSWSEAQAGSVGSRSTERYLPMAMAENTKLGLTWFWQIEHNGSWYWEISNVSARDNNADDVYAYLGGPDDLMAGIGYGKYSARQVLGKLTPVTETPAAPLEDESAIGSVVRRVFGGDSSNAIRVKGHGDLLVYRARCCNPIRGEAVVGYVTRGKGVAVHSINCPNVLNLMYEPERRIDVEWGKEDGAPSSFPVKLTVFCDDRFGMLKQITAVISDTKTNIRSIGARTENGQANVDIVIEIEDLKHLESIIQGVRKIPGVHDVQRLQRV